jgi:CRISPR-associated protein Cas1
MAEKTQITNFDRGFRFLGHTFSGDLVVEDRSNPQSVPTRAKDSGLRLVHADPLVEPTAMQQAMVTAL